MFEEVATINGAGNSNNILHYEFKHENPRELEYYRLRQVDFDGKWAYSKIISVRRNPILEVDVYPNPSTSDLFFDISKSENGVFLVKYTDLTGRVKEELINASEGTNKYQLTLFNELESGIYFIQILDEQGNALKTDKIIKQ